MYSNNMVHFQDSTTILNAYMKIVKITIKVQYESINYQNNLNRYIFLIILLFISDIYVNKIFIKS